MSMFMIYKKHPEETIRNEAAEAIVQIEEWFRTNPRRRVCRAAFWYERRHGVRKGHVAEDVNKIADDAIAN